MKKLIKKSLSLCLAVGACVSSLTMFTACESARPELKMQLSFNNKKYEIEYVLYRKIAPSTVEHFLSLVENKYYDGLCIHDYTGDRMYTGAYTYKETQTYDGGLSFKNYYTLVKDYDTLPLTVFKDGKGIKNDGTPLYTLYGEFADNHFSVKNGSLLKETFGSLTMYYTDKGDMGESYVYINPINSNTWLTYNAYEYNSATSQFFISLTEEEKTNTKYCTFATPTDNGEDVLEDLMDDVADYIEDTYGESDNEFCEKVTLNVNQGDAFASEEGITQTYSVPKEPIIIEWIKVTKW